MVAAASGSQEVISSIKFLIVNILKDDWFFTLLWCKIRFKRCNWKKSRRYFNFIKE